MKYELSLIIMLLAASYCCVAETFLADETIAIHPKAGFYYNIYQSDFYSFPNSVPCNNVNYNNGHGFGYGLGLALERSLSNRLQLSLGLNYVKRSGSFYDDTKYNYRTPDYEIGKATVRNQIDASLYYFEIQPDIRYVILEKLINAPFRLYGGVRLAFPAIYDFVQDETILSPNDAYFDYDAKKSKNHELASGKIGDINSLILGFSVGFDNMLKIGERLHWTQQIGFDYTISDVVKDVDWKAHALHFSMGLRFSIGKEKPYFDADTLELNNNEYKLIVQNSNKDEIIPEQKNIPSIVPATLSLEEAGFEGEIQTGTELLATKPIVNAIFFDNNSAEIPNYIKYKQLNIDDYYNMNALEQHKYIFPRIVGILNANLKATITIEGATAGAKFEPKGIELAHERAENIKQKFIKLGIDASRIKTVAKITPRYPSNNKHEDGISENQRADIFITNAPLQEYVDFIRFNELSGTLKYDVSVANNINSKINQPFLYSSIADTAIHVDEARIYDFNIKKRIATTDESIVDNAQLFIGNRTKDIENTIDLKKLRTVNIEKTYRNFEAIIRFEYNSDVLSSDNKNLLKQMTEKLPEGYIIQISGGADALGSEERNIQLSNRRALVTRDYINSIKKDKFIFETGVINDDKKFNENTPQGRFLNRSMILRIKQ